jgi:uncharacterized protein (TIGR02300 family)
MAELGNKHECFNCSAKFYDLGNPEPICPKCGANQKDARKQEAANEAVHAKRRRREEPVRSNDEEPEDLIPSTNEADLGDEELVTPERSDDDAEDLDESGDDDLDDE